MTRRRLVDRLHGLVAGSGADDTLDDTIVDGEFDTMSAHQRRILAPAPYVCGGTDVGRVREHNEDAFHVSSNGRIMVVADGMGGHMAGDVASAIAVETLVDLLGADRLEVLKDDATIARMLVSAFQAAHDDVLQAAQERPECCNMGTTLIAGYIRGGRLHTCHVGDVRGYVLSGDTLRQVTEDHSVVGDLLRSGKISPAEARRHPRRNEVLQAVGLPMGISPSVGSSALDPGAIVMLCSDGLWEMVSDEEIVSILRSRRTLRDRVVEMLERANAAGGRDNVTVVAYEHGD
jgi:protein phosphatase